MKIIDLGICINNKDPKGMGRIRCIDYDDFISGKENVQKYEQWSENDPFMALPFLPNNINFIPEENQAVKIIRYNTEKTTVNQEYIAGPFTTRFDFNGQTYSQQISSTTYGVPFKGKKDFVNSENGELPEKSKGTLSKPKDYSISGKYGSDVVLTEDGVLIRGGKLLSKESASPSQREELLDVPLTPNKVSKFHLKKYPTKLVRKKEVTTNQKTENGVLKYIIEYSIDDLSTPETINFFVYKVGEIYGDKFRTNSFNNFTDISSSPVELLNDDDTTTTQTRSIDLTSLEGYSSMTLDNKIKTIGSVIRTTLIDIKTNGFGEFFSTKIRGKFDNEQELTNIFPLYFRPAVEFNNRSTSTTILKETKKSILTSVKLTQRGPITYGLIWSESSFSPPTINVENEKEVLRKDSSSIEQTFSSLLSDKIYFLSTDTNFTDKTIAFDKLDKYEFTQDDYLNQIDPNTYALVRGEVLLEFLRAMFNVLTTHVHNINKPYVQKDYDAHENLTILFNRLEQELLNKSIRTN